MNRKEFRETVTEAYRVRDKIENIDDKSVYFKNYSIASMALMGAVMIVALCTKIFGVAILSGALLMISALLFWANNREYKRVRFAVGRRLPIIMGFLQVQVIVALIAMISFQ